MKDFLTDEEITELEAQQGPADFLTDEEMTELERTEEGPSMAESVAQGVREGASLGFMDELGGHMEALGSKVGVRGLGGSFSDIRLENPEEDKLTYDEVYTQARDKRRAATQKAREANPTAFTAGDVGASLLIPAGGSRSLGSMAMKGLATGAAQGLGRSDRDKLSMDTVNDVALGAGLGLVAGTALPLAGKAVKGIRKGAEKATSTFKGVRKSGQITKDLADNPELEKEVFSVIESLDKGLADDAAKIIKEGKLVNFLENVGKDIKEKDLFRINLLDIALPTVFGVTGLGIAAAKKIADSPTVRKAILEKILKNKHFQEKVASSAKKMGTSTGKVEKFLLNKNMEPMSGPLLDGMKEE